MKKTLLLFIAVLSFTACNAQQKTEFTSEALNNVMLTKDNTQITFQDILNKYEGKTIFIDVWASWCPDCIKGMPKVKELQKENPELIFLFISMDKNYESWVKGIEKYNVQGEHYLTTDGMKGVFGKSIDLDWIPRYMIISKEGKIAMYKAIEADDDLIKDTFSQLQN